MSKEAAMEAVMPASERTQSISVITRIVAKDGDVFKEVEKPDIVFVRPLPFLRWPKAIEHITNMFRYLPEEGIDVNNSAQVLVWLGSAIGVASEDLFAVLEMATDRKPEFFDTIDADDGLKIAVAVVEINKSFFVESVWPIIKGQLPAIAEMFGQTPLQS